MPTTKLQILVSGEPLDLIEGEETRFFITRILQDLSNLSTRNSDFTNTITVPTTNHNLRLLEEQVPDKARFIQNPTTTVDCQVWLGGLPVLSDAYFLVSNQTDKTLRLTIYSGTAKFFARIPDDSIKALNFAEYDLDWTLTDVQAITNTTEGALYGDIGWFTNESVQLAEAQGADFLRTGLREVYLAESGFQFFIHTILDKIYAGVDRLTFNLSELDARYLELVVCCPVPLLHDQFSSITGFYSEVRNTTGDDLVVGIDTLLEFPTVITDDDNLWNGTTEEFTLPSGIHNIRARLSGNIRAISSMVFTLLDSSDNVIGQTTVESQGNSNRTYDLEISETVNVGSSESYRIVYSLAYGSGSNDATIDFAQFYVEQQGVGRGTRVTISDYLPDISQRDFVREVYNLMNIVPTIQEDEITLRHFKDITKGGTLKLDVSKGIERSNTLLPYGQTTVLKYADNEAVLREDADTFFTVNSLTLQRTATAIDSQFSATDPRYIIGTGASASQITVPNYDVVYNFNGVNTCDYGGGGASLVNNMVTASPHGIEPGDYIYIGTERRKVISVPDSVTATVDVDFAASGTAQTWYHWAFEKKDVQMHIGRTAVAAPSTNSYTIIDGGTSASVQGRQVTMEFIKWDTLKEDYYDIIVRSFFKPYLVQAWTNLPVTKLLEVSGKLEAVYIEDLNGWFYINKIEQWKFNNSCRLQLIQLEI